MTAFMLGPAPIGLMAGAGADFAFPAVMAKTTIIGGAGNDRIYGSFDTDIHTWRARQ